MTQAPVIEERPIVLHGPLTGDPERVVAYQRPVPTTTSTAFTAPAATTFVATTVAPHERVFGLDALRAVLVLAMNFTFTLPPWGPFPKWMYHTQVPPAQKPVYVDVAGLTWQDMVFAMFVFTMAAAIPIAVSARLARGRPYPEIVWWAIRRAAMLLLFSLIIGHVNPYWTNDYTRRGNLLALVGFAVSFGIFVQPPRSWPESAVKWMRRLAWAGVVVVLFGIPRIYGQSFDATKHDGIISAFGFCILAATVIWLATRQRPLVRAGLFAAIVAARLLSSQVGVLGALWRGPGVSLVYEPWYLDLLLIVIPGTFAGELVHRWTRTSAAPSADGFWSRRRLSLLAALGLSFLVILNVGLYERRYPLATTIAVIAVAGAMIAIARGARSERDRVLGRLVQLGAALLVAGMLVEPLEGGIRKDPQTLGFLLLMAGSATTSLASLLILGDAMRSTAVQRLSVIGQNPLFAYVVLMLCLEHLLWLTGFGDAFTSSVFTASLRSIAVTTLAGVVVYRATRRGLLWKT